MTTTEAETFPTLAHAIAWRASPFVRDMFEGVGTYTLERTIEEGRLPDVVDAEELQRYVSLAAFALGAPPAMNRTIWETMMHRMFAVFMGEEASHYRNVDGEPGYVNDNGSVTVVTDQILRHWEWLFMLTSHESAARSLLDAVPAVMRDEAEARIAKTNDDAFEEIVRGLASPDPD